MDKTRQMNLFSLIHLWGLLIAIGLLSACSNSEYADEFAPHVSDYALEEGSQDTAFIKDTLTEFPPSGFYPRPFTILFPDNKSLNCEIGGFAPTKESPLKKEISIDSTSTIRCINFSDKSSTETIRTYIFEKKPTIPTIFITADPNSLFNPDTGIYMEGPNAEENAPHYGANYWLDKEIPIFIESIEKNSATPAFAKYAGLKIFGNYSRIYAKKSVSITFRKKYGDKQLYYKLFPDYPNLSKFKSFILRNNGQNFHHDYIRDRLASSISEGLDVDYQRGRFVIAYYNGDYFGIHDLREKSNEYYFETHYGLNHNNINLLKANNSVSSGSSDEYVSLMDWIKRNDLENDDNYAYIASKIDISNYINYMQVEIFADNRDWLANNIKIWNCTNPQTPWRWFLYDIDWGFGLKSYNEKNSFNYVLSESGRWQPLLYALLANNNFKTTFINQFTTLLHTNFETSKTNAAIEQMMSEINAEISRDQKRWSLDASKMDEHLRIIKQFAIDRPSNLILHLQEYFKLGETIPITFSIKGEGTIYVHNLPIYTNKTTINFFKGLPVTITAIPQNNGIWSSWNDGDSSAIKTIYPSNETEFTAIFK